MECETGENTGRFTEFMNISFPGFYYGFTGAIIYKSVYIHVDVKM